MNVGRSGSIGIDDLYMAMMELEQEQRKTARDVRHAAEDAQVEAMRDEADHIEQQAIWNAAGQALEGVMSAASAGAKLGGSEATSAMIDSSNKLNGAYFTYRAGIEEADQKRAAARATAQGQAAQDARDVEERAGEMRQTLERRLEQAQEAQNASMAAILRA